jgi:hypothetical protein
MRLRRLTWYFIATVALFLSLISLYFGLTSSRDNASGWFQVFLEALSLPVLLYGIYRLREELRKESWKPEISIGVTSIEPLSEVRRRTTLPTRADISQGYTCFQLLVRNEGKLAARFVKMHLEFESVGDTSYRNAAKLPVEELAAPTVEIPEDNPFEWQNNKDFIFTGGADWIIYPQDNTAFTFCLGTVVKGQPPVPHDYRFHCTVWAEGLDCPAEEDLVVRIVEAA